MTLTDSTDTVVDQKTVKIGFRTVAVVQDPIADGKHTDDNYDDTSIE